VSHQDRPDILIQLENSMIGVEIPSGNVELRDRVTSPSLRPKGGNMSEAWKSVLEEPIRYIVITPEDFLKPALDCEDTRSIAAYLEKRYWSS
jgi:hypothetical protein